MANDTIIQQGRFTSTGSAQTIQLRSDLDWMKVYNTTIAAGDQTTAIGVEYYWQRGFPAGAQWEYLKSNAASAANLSQYLTTGGFTLVDTSAQQPGILHTGSGAGQSGITAISNATIPVATNANTNGLSAGDVVRIINVAGAQQLGSVDFTVGRNTLSTTTFSLDYMSKIVAGTTGSWRKINYDPLYYPRRRTITKITQTASAVVTMSVTHGYQVGQAVRFVVPAAFGMVELDSLQGTITAIDTTLTTGNTITVNIDTTAFTAFAFPVTASYPFTYAEVVPVGEDTAQALTSGVDILTDATINTGYIGIILAGGANSPGGSQNDVVYWVAGKSFSVTNL